MHLGIRGTSCQQAAMEQTRPPTREYSLRTWSRWSAVRYFFFLFFFCCLVAGYNWKLLPKRALPWPSGTPRWSVAKTFPAVRAAPAIHEATAPCRSLCGAYHLPHLLGFPKVLLDTDSHGGCLTLGLASWLASRKFLQWQSVLQIVFTAFRHRAGSWGAKPAALSSSLGPGSPPCR